MENIEVSVRLRPLNHKEAFEVDEHVWKVEPTRKTITLTQPKMLNQHPSQQNQVSKQKQGMTALTNQNMAASQSSSFYNQTMQSMSPYNKSTSPYDRRERSKSKGRTSPIMQPQFNQTTLIQRDNSQSSLQSASPNASSNSNTNTEIKKKVSYQFDLCFGEETSNHAVYESMVKRIVLSSLNGINGTVFVYGQTGSGKTYTMLGRERKEVISQQQQQMPQTRSKDSTSSKMSRHSPEKQDATPSQEAAYLSGRQQKSQTEQPGVLIYALEDLFNEIKEDAEKTYFLRCSYVEIYNEQVYDLLRDEESINEQLSLNEDKNKDFYIRGVIEEPVSSIEEILYFLRRGELNRHYAQTKLNHSSSRSHTLFRLQVQSITNNFLSKTTPEQLPLDPKKEASKEAKKYVTQSVLNFVDLAGSEKVSSHYDNKDPDELYVMNFGDQVPTIDNKVKSRVQEGKNINKSLFFLTQVISLRAEGKSNQSHIPYRNSPLTKILRSSLGGNARTSVIVCLTPSQSQLEQTLSSLRFGQNAMKIENKVHANIISNNNEEAVKILLADYERKIKSLEKVKKEQQSKRENEMRMIEMLLEEKKKLSDKINQINMKRFKQITSSCQLIDHEMLQYSQRKYQGMLAISGVGTLEIPDTLSNYITHLYEKKRVERRGKSLSRTEHPYVEQSYRTLSLEVLESARETKIISQEHILALEHFISELKRNNQMLEEQLFKAQDFLSNKGQSSQKITSKVKDLYNENETLKLKESFYEGFDNQYIRQVKDEWLQQLEQKFTLIIEKLKEEKARRHYKGKIENLQEQIRNLKNTNGQDTEQQQTLESVLQLLQQSECQSLLEGVNCMSLEQQRQSHELSGMINDTFTKQETQSVDEEDSEAVQKFKSDVEQVLKHCSLSKQRYDDKPDLDSNFKSKFTKLQDDIKVREGLLNESNNKLEKMHQKLGSQYEQTEIVKSPQAKVMNPGLLTQKRNIVKRQKKRNKSLQMNLQKKSASQPHIEVQQKKIKKPQNNKKKPRSLSRDLNQESVDQTDELSVSLLGHLQEEQKSQINLFSNLHFIQQCSANASSVINVIKDLDQALHTDNRHQSFQLEASTFNDDDRSDQYKAFQIQDLPCQFEDDYCEKKRESIAMTHRESKQDLQSNNLFETLQANLDQFNHNGLVINANDYVSFKQTSSTKSCFVLENHHEKQMAYNAIVYNTDDKLTEVDDELNHISEDYHYKENGDNIISLNFSKQSAAHDKTACFKPILYSTDQHSQNTQSLKEISNDLRVGLKQRSSLPKQMKTSKSFISIDPSRENMTIHSARKEEVKKIPECMKQFSHLLFTSRKSDHSPNRVTVSPTQPKTSRTPIRNENKAPIEKTKVIVSGKLGIQQKKQANIFQHSRHQQVIEGKVFQPLLARSRGGPSILTKNATQTTDSDIKSQISELTPRAVNKKGKYKTSNNI